MQKNTLSLRKEGYDTLKVLDRDVDLYMEDVLKIKNRDSRRELVQAALDCKKKITNVMEILRAALDK